MEEREERGRTWVHPVVIKYRQSTRLVPAIEERSVHRMTVTVQAQAAHHVHHIVDCDSCAKSQNGANRKKFPYLIHPTSHTHHPVYGVWYGSSTFVYLSLRRTNSSSSPSRM